MVPKPSVPIMLEKHFERGGGVQSVTFLSMKDTKMCTHCATCLLKITIVKLGNTLLWILLCISSKYRDEVVYL